MCGLRYSLKVESLVRDFAFPTTPVVDKTATNVAAIFHVGVLNSGKL